ncbi:MAG: DUF4974 domain-containing protein [Allomuricauda sp.]
MKKTHTLHIALSQIIDKGSLDETTKNLLSKEEENLVKQLQEEGLVGQALQIIEDTDLESNWETLKNRLKIEETNTGKVRALARKEILKYAAIFIGGILGSFSIYWAISKNSIDNETLNLGKDQIILTQADGSKKILSDEHTAEVKMLDGEGNEIGVQKGKVLDYSAVKNEQVGEELVYNELTVPLGKRFELILSDGTQVSLNSGTHMRYPIAFSKKGRRDVTITGEAYFKVEKDSTRPFVVSFQDNLNIEVLGTQFNVSTYAEGVDVETVLVEGSVAIYENGQPEGKQFLTPGHKAEWHKENGNISISPANIRLYTGWLTGELIFRNAGLESIVPKLERAYDVTIHCNLQEFADKRYDASFQVDLENIEEVMHHLSRVAPIDYNIQGKEIFIKKRQ